MNGYGYVGDNPINLYDPYGLWAWGDPVPDWLVDATAGYGDAVSLGGTSLARALADIDGGVNKCSPAYRACGWVSFALGSGRLAYAGIAKGYSAFGPSGAAASALRSRLRDIFGGGKSLRPPDLTRYPTDAALRAAAGRTNPVANAYGVAVTAKGAAERQRLWLYTIAVETYPIIDKTKGDYPFAFEIDNAYEKVQRQ